MIVLTLLAGEGQRFKNAGITIPKPLVSTGTRTILEETTRSLPFIRHYNEPISPCIPEEFMYFAVQEKHNLVNYLRDVYGDGVNIFTFKEVTRGNLITAKITAESIDKEYKDMPLLILDGDNKYNSSGILNTILQIQRYSSPQMMCTYFARIDDSNKWAFAVFKNYSLIDIIEKPDIIPVGARPLIGTFYFSSINLFLEYANKVIEKNETINGEYYLSQILKEYVREGKFLQSHAVYDVVPLGTPEDVWRYIETQEMLYE